MNFTLFLNPCLHAETLRKAGSPLKGRGLIPSHFRGSLPAGKAGV